MSGPMFYAHSPCCSAHGVNMTCAEYRDTHFVEVRPCCAADRRDLVSHGDHPNDSYAYVGCPGCVAEGRS